MKITINRSEIQAFANLTDNFEKYNSIASVVAGEQAEQSEDGRSQLQKAEGWINDKLGKTLDGSTKIAKCSVTLLGNLEIAIDPNFIKEGLELYGALVVSISEPVGQVIKTLMGSTTKIETFVEEWNVKYVS